MKYDSLNQWLTLMANIAVFASIMFLAVEIRQNQTAIEESNRLSILDARALEIEQFNEFRSMVLQDSELSRIWDDGNAGRDLSPSDATRFGLLCANVIWISAGSFERSVALDRLDAAAATTAIRAAMIDDSEYFRDCWLSLRDTLVAYGVSEYVDAVERGVKTDLAPRDQ